jgi:hypothetical protein
VGGRECECLRDGEVVVDLLCGPVPGVIHRGGLRCGSTNNSPCSRCSRLSAARRAMSPPMLWATSTNVPESFPHCRDGGPVTGQLVAHVQRRSWPTCARSLRIAQESHDTPRKAAWGERSCSQICSNTADFADVREGSPVSKSLVAVRIRSWANCGEHAAEDWGSRGRRFKSCHPDGKQQVIPEGTGPCQDTGDLRFELSSIAAHTSR